MQKLGSFPQPTGQGGTLSIYVKFLEAGEGELQLGASRVTDEVSWTDEGVLNMIPYFDVAFNIAE